MNSPRTLVDRHRIAFQDRDGRHRPGHTVASAPPAMPPPIMTTIVGLGHDAPNRRVKTITLHVTALQQLRFEDVWLEAGECWFGTTAA